MTRTVKIVLAVALVAALIAGLVCLPIAPWMREMVAWVRHQGATGLAVYSLVFIAICLMLLPTIELYLAAGMLYGTLWGALLVTLLGVIVELLTQALLHTRVRRPIEARMHKHPRLAAFDKGFAQHSFWILLLLRFSPVMPFAPLNYALSLTKAPLWQRIVANVLGMLPCSLMIAYFGSFLTSTRQLGTASPPSVWKHIAIWTGIAATIVAGWLAARATKHVLDHEQHAH